MSPSDLRALVPAAAARSYEISDHPTQLPIAEDPTLIYCKKLRRLEKVCVDRADLESYDTRGLQSYREAGVQVWVLVPLEEMGKAHARMRESVDRIQPWWLDPDTRSIKFGSAELP